MLSKKTIIVKSLVLILTCISYTFSTHTSLYKAGFSSNIKGLGDENRTFIGFILNSAKRHDLPPALITAVIHAESNFKPTARSYAGAVGLMQINAVTAKYLRVKNIHDPKTNIEAGTRYLRELYSLFGGKLELALAAYNAGPGAVKKYKGIPPYKETKRYVAKVLKLYHYYKTGEPI